MSTFPLPLILVVPFAGSIVCAAWRRRRVLEIVAVGASAATFLAVLWLAASVSSAGAITSPGGWWYADALSVYVMIVVSGSGLVVALYSVGYLRRQIRKRKIRGRQLWLYYLLLDLFLFTMMLVLLSNNLGFLWIGIEATTLATAFLVAFYERESSIEAAWKYVIICSVGIALALFGIILTYFSALHVVPASADALNWSTLMLAAGGLDPGVLKLAFIFILVGFGTKAGLAPMHTWKPDAYAEAPAPISALLASGLVNVAMYALMRFEALVNKAVGGGYASTLLLILGLLSMAVAVPFILVQRDYKRLLAYSSVEHVGIMAFAIGLGTPLAAFGALLHMLNNALAKLLLFLTAGNVRMAFDSKIIRRVSGAITVIPASATFLILGVFAVTGWPPFGMFVSEFTILSAGFASGHVAACVIFIVCVVAVFFGFIYYGSGMVFGVPHGPAPGREAGMGTLILLGVLAAALLLLGLVMPEPLRRIIDQAVTVLRG